MAKKKEEQVKEVVQQPQVEEKKEQNSKSKIIVYIVIILLCLCIVGGFLFGLFNKKLTADELICQKINAYLKSSSYKFTTYSRLVDDLEGQGFYLDNLSPSVSGNYFIYNEDGNQFALVSELTSIKPMIGELASEKYYNWVVTHNRSELSQTKEYSHYLAYDYKDSNKSIEINASLDCGQVDPFENIAYVSTTKSTETAKHIIVVYAKEIAKLTISGKDNVKEYNLVRETEEE